MRYKKCHLVLPALPGTHWAETLYQLLSPALMFCLSRILTSRVSSTDILEYNDFVLCGVAFGGYTMNARGIPHSNSKKKDRIM